MHNSTFTISILYIHNLKPPHSHISEQLYIHTIVNVHSRFLYSTFTHFWTTLYSEIRLLKKKRRQKRRSFGQGGPGSTASFATEMQAAQIWNAIWIIGIRQADDYGILNVRGKIKMNWGYLLCWHGIYDLPPSSCNGKEHDIREWICKQHAVLYPSN